MNSSRTFRPVALVVLAAVFATLSGCASDSPTESAKKSPSTTLTAPGPADTGGLRVPDTLPNGAFPSVADPPSDGPLADAAVKLTTVARADAPTDLVARPGHPSQLFLAERAGRVRLVTVDAQSGGLTVQPGALLDLTDRIATDGEKGLLGLAFDRTGSELYLDYTLKNGDTRIDATKVTDPEGVPHLGQPRKLLEIDQMGTNFHKGGGLAVDDEGHLFIGMGDGGPQRDRDDHARNPDLLLGKILRIDPTSPTDGRPYGIPEDNPFASSEQGAPEIYLTGLRNPWRISIDPDNGDLWIGDVGQHRIEEIDRLPPGPVSAGANLGWSGFEGTEVFDASRIDGTTVPPIFERSHDDGSCSITGGVVYRGEKIPDLQGAFLFADLCRPGLDVLRATTPKGGIGRVTDFAELDGTSDATQVISFATDASGEVYVLSLDDTIRRLDPTV